MWDQVLGTGLGAIIGAAVGGAITAKVVSAVTKAELKALGDLTRVELSAMAARVDKHEKAFERVVYRDTCDASKAACKDSKDERHAEVVRRLESLEQAFRSCFDDLVGALRSKSNS